MSITQRVEGILEESRKIEFRETMQVWFGALFFAIGWFIGTCTVGFLKTIWRVVAFLWVSVEFGFKTAFSKRGG